MGWTKQQLVAKAFGVTGLAEANLAAEDLLEGLSSLDAMVTSWETRGIRLGYLASSDPNEGDLAQESGVPTWAIRAVYLNLGIELAAVSGREVSPDTRSLAQQAFDGVRIRCCRPPTMKLGPTVPAGGGNRPWYGQNSDFIVEDDGEIDVESDSQLEFE